MVVPRITWDRFGDHPSGLKVLHLQYEPPSFFRVYQLEKDTIRTIYYTCRIKTIGLEHLLCDL